MKVFSLIAAVTIFVGFAASANSQPPGKSGQPEGEVVRILWGRD